MLCTYINSWKLLSYQDIWDMNPPLKNNSNGTSNSIEGLSSSTAARNKRGDWLSPNNSRTVIKIFLVLAIISVAATTIIMAVPLIKIIYQQQKASRMNTTTTQHKMIKNDTYIAADQLETDELLKSFGLEKDALQLCNLNPESKNELGKGTWTLLHIMASTYPVNPTPEIIQDHRIFFQLLPRIYPCPDCRAHMRQMFNELPPQLKSRNEFMNWICEAHNRVNLRLNKPTFDCSKHDERWDCGCNIVPGQVLNSPEPQPQEIVEVNVKETGKTRHSRKSRAQNKPDTRTSKKEHRVSRTAVPENKNNWKIGNSLA